MTIQSLDQIEYEGQVIAFHGPDMPSDHPEVPKDFPNFEGPTSMQRGYEATWALRDGALYLTSVSGKWSMLGHEPVLADWVSDQIAIPMGPVIGQDIWYPVHERTIYLKFSSGRLQSTEEVWNVPPSQIHDLDF